MLDFLTSEYFIGMVIGFALLYMFQVLFKGPQEADRDERIDEYMERLSDDARSLIEERIADKDKIGAIKIFREDTNVGPAEGKECIEFIANEMKKRA